MCHGVMTKHELAEYWLLAFFGALTVVSGKLGYLLFAIAEQPPEEPAQYMRWRRKRRWLVVSELLALPMFATLAITSAVYFKMPIIAAILIAMALGALGFGFLLNALQYLARRKLKEVQS